MSAYEDSRASLEWDDPDQSSEDDQGVWLAQRRLVALSESHHAGQRKYDGGRFDQNEAPAVRQPKLVKRILTPLFKKSVRQPEAQPPARRYGSSERDLELVRYGEPDGPILDVRSLLQGCYDSRWLIIFLILAGMICGGTALLFSARKYTAHASLFFDPQQIQFQWDSQDRSSNSPQASASRINSQIEILTSTAVLKAVSKDLDLASDPAFALPSSIEDKNYAIASLLKKAVSTSRADNSYVVALNVTTGEPVKSAEIANAIIDAYQEHETETNSAFYSGILESYDIRLAELRTKLKTAEDAVDQYRAKNDLVTAKGELISEDQLVSLTQALVEAQQNSIKAQAKVDASKRLNPDVAIAGISDNEVTSATLVDLRRQYATAVANVGQLQTQLGTSHPKLAAAKASLNGLRAEVREEVKRIASIAETELQQARNAEQQVAKELTTQKALKFSKSASQGELDKLELQATAVRNIYEAVLKRTREANEEQSIVQSNMRVISEAEPPVTADGPGRSLRLVGGLFGGALLGFGLGLVIVVIRTLSRNPVVRSYFSFTSQTSARARERP